jgi:hypothetical protein
VTDLALLDGTSPLWDTQIFSFRTIDEAVAVARSDRAGSISSAVAHFSALRARLPAVVTPNYLQSPIVQSELQQVVAAAPNHLSAATLLRAATNQLPKGLSLNGSVEAILSTSYLFIHGASMHRRGTYGSDSKAGLTRFPEREYNDAMVKLRAFSPLLDSRTLNLKMACVAYAVSLRADSNLHDHDSEPFVNGRRADFDHRARETYQDVSESYESALAKLLAELQKLKTENSLDAELFFKF